MRKDVPLKYVKYKEGTKYRDPKIPPEEYNDNADSFWDAGLMIDDNTVVIDIDIEGMKDPHALINNIIREFGIETQTVYTDRGAHLYFDKPRNYTHRANYIAKLGMPVEAKRATTKHNSITVKRNGVLRKIMNPGTYADFPEIFEPIKKKGDTTKLNMLGLERGGRNDSVFGFRIQLNNSEIADKITVFANRYLITDPMEDSEVAAICNSAQNYISDDSDMSEEYAIAEKVIHELRTVVHNGTLYMMENSEPIKWTSEDDMIQKTIFEDYCKGRTTAFFRGVYDSVRRRSPIKHKNAVFPVRFRNGILEDGEFIYGDNSTFTPYMIDINYNPEATPVAAVDNYLTHLTDGDEPYRKLIEEVMGHTLITDFEKKKTLGKFFMFHGGGGNGKGTFLEILAGILGTDNISNLSPEQMIIESYANNMIGKLANLGDDIEDSAFDDKKMKMIKNISTCDIIQMRYLNRNGFQARLTCTLIFTTNHEIKSFEKGESYKRRVVWLPMFTKVKKKDPKFISSLTTPEALSYWAKLMVEGYIRLYENGDFTSSPVVDAFNEQYHENNDNTIEYVREAGEEIFLDATIGDVYEAYEVWCNSQKYNPLSVKKVKEQLLAQYNLANDKVFMRNGVRGRYFYKKDV